MWKEYHLTNNRYARDNRLRVSIVLVDETVWHLDVGLSHPAAVVGCKGSAVRRIKWYVSWVQNVVRQFGPYLLQMLKIEKIKF